MRDDSYYELGHISEAMKEELMEPEFKQFCREKDEQLLKVVNAEFRNLVAFQFARQNFNKFKISGTHDMREHSNNDINSNLLEACDWTGWEITTNEEYPRPTFFVIRIRGSHTLLNCFFFSLAIAEQRESSDGWGDL